MDQATRRILDLFEQISRIPRKSKNEERVSRWLHECDIVPENYVIDWRVPMIGPIHAAIRRVIYAEIRRSVLPALTKQSHLNRAVLQTLSELCQENARLRQELEALRQNQEPER